MSGFLRAIFVTAFAFIVIVFGNYVIVAQTTTGKWKADAQKKSEGLQLSLYRETSKGERNQFGQSFDYAELRGLSPDQVAIGGNVRFTLDREAGNIEFSGSFLNGKGSGAFVFNANPNFVSGMKSRGFDFEKYEGRNEGDDPAHRLLTAAMLNVTTALADDLLSADFGKLDVDDLFKAKIFNVDSNYMREMKASGFKNLEFEDLVKGRIFKIDGDFLRELAQNGLDNEPFENVVKMRIFKITPEFINGVRAEGFQKLDIEDLVKLKIFNIDADFIRKARADGVPMEVEKLVQKKIGVWTK